MISTKATPEQFERYVSNIITRYGQASIEQKIAGERWYVTANQLAHMISDGEIVKGAGVIAALSANKSWSENVKISKRTFATGTASGHVRRQLEKAERIMLGEDPETVLGGHKTLNFYRCLVNPQHPSAVCIDRHAHDVAVGETYGDRDRGLSAQGRYNLLADAYREAARRLGTNPATVQAVTWVVQVESNSGTSHRGTTNGRADR